MYKVFIENTLLHIIDQKDFIPNNALVLFEEDLDVVKKSLLLLLNQCNTDFQFYLVSPNPSASFSKLFEGFEFVEAAGGIVQRKDSFLFIKRNGFWDIPKGKLEDGESPELGAKREIEEECGISGPKIKHFICETYHTYLYKGRPTIKKTHWYALNYEGASTLKGQIEEGITKVRWFKKAEIDKIKKNTFGSIIEVMNLYFDNDTDESIK